MFNPNIINLADYLKNPNRERQPNPQKQALPSNNSSYAPVDEAEALMLVLESSAYELNKPMAAALRLSERLLAQTDPDTPLAQDLKMIVNEMRHAREVVRGLQILTHNQLDFPTH
jgi:hypothetical protein